MVRLRDVTPSDLRRLVCDLEARGQQPSTVRKNLAPVKLLFATALQDGDLERSPAAHLRIRGKPLELGVHGPRRKALTHSELRALLEAVDQDWRLFIAFLAHSGLRIAEAIALHWTHFDLGDTPTVSVRQQYRNGVLKPPKTIYSIPQRSPSHRA